MSLTMKMTMRTSTPRMSSFVFVVVYYAFGCFLYVNEIVSIHELKPFVSVICDEFVNS